MAEGTTLPHPQPITVRGEPLAFGERTLVMGIINLTDDSFSGDGIGGDVLQALEQATHFVAEGADILDVGGESTRPGSDPVSLEQELARVIPTVEALRECLPAIISVDTSKPEVARAALRAGADIINDVTGLRTPGMIEVAAEAGAPVVIMHMLGTPRGMQHNPRYGDVVTEVRDFLAGRIAAAVAGGIAEQQVIIDPGFGFGKTVQHNLELLRRLRELCALQRPILIGTSRKSTIGRVLGVRPEDRVFGTAATCAVAIQNGADIIRVHDVRGLSMVARMTDAIVRGWHEA